VALAQGLESKRPSKDLFDLCRESFVIGDLSVGVREVLQKSRPSGLPRKRLEMEQMPFGGSLLNHVDQRRVERVDRASA
jgi:hypothetical protein